MKQGSLSGRLFTMLRNEKASGKFILTVILVLKIFKRVCVCAFAYLRVCAFAYLRICVFACLRVLAGVLADSRPGASPNNSVNAVISSENT